jgi:hypothetical protein
MGLLGDLGVISHLDANVIERVLQQIGRVGLMQGGVRPLPEDPAEILRVLQKAAAALEDSPLPQQEWAPLRATLGDELLARLCGISEVSLRRYATGIRATPDAVANRLHVLALVVADLRGAYNDYGIRRWFQRPRAQLGGRSPEEYLPRLWSPDSAEVAAVRALAASLSGSPAT